MGVKQLSFNYADFGQLNDDDREGVCLSYVLRICTFNSDPGHFGIKVRVWILLIKENGSGFMFYLLLNV